MSLLTKENLTKYNLIKRDAKHLAAKEMDMRKAIVKEAFENMVQNGSIPDGTVKGKFVYDMECAQIKFELPTTIKIDEEALSDDWDILEDNERQCFKEKTVYSLVKKNFDAAKEAAESDDEITFRVEEYLTEKPSAPTVDVDLF